jgi:DHA2 family methylenomycin A resistance protein-like MFS transporter
VHRGRLVLIATSLAAFTATLDNTVVAVALRDIQSDLGSGVTGLQGVVTAYTVTLAALLLAGGALVDVVGARRVLVLGLLGFAAASIGCATAGSVTALVTWRAVQGGGAALLLPGGLAVLAGAYPDPVRRKHAIGLWAAAGGLALVAGPVVGGELVARQGWPSVFWVNVPLCSLVLALLLFARSSSSGGGSSVPQPQDEEDRREGRMDGPGILLTCAALGTATYAVVLAGRHGLSAGVALALLVSATSAALLWLVERRSADPLLPGVLLRSQVFRGAMAGAFAAALAVFVLMVFLSLFLQLVQDLDARQTGMVLLPLPLALVVTAPFAGRWHAVVAPVVLGLLLAGGGLLAIGLALHVGTGRHEVEAWLAVVGAGVGLTTAPVVTAALGVAGEARAGLAAASVNVARELGGVVAIGGLGALAVARLSARLTDVLATIGVPANLRPQLLDLMLGARRTEARRVLLRDVGVDKALAGAQLLQDSATASFVASTRLVLQFAGVLLLVLAAVSALLLRHTPERADRTQ